MAEPFVGEIRMFAGNFAPSGWLTCEGQLLPISEFETLFVLLGTTYGGDGESTFQLPDLRGRIPLHQGNGFVLAETGGHEQVSLLSSQVPAHTHGMPVSSATATSGIPTGNAVADTSGAGMLTYQTAAAASVPMSAAAVGSVGQSLPHENRMPFLCVTFIISLFGIFPSQS
jgi:microcystin-dependent protein